MNIKDFAKIKQISTQAVYQKIKASGLSLDDLREEKTGDLSEQGLQALETLFTKQTVKTSEATTRILTELKVENEFLKKRNAELEADRDAWKAAAEKAQQIANQAQSLNLANLQALPAPKVSIWERITGKKK